MDHPDDLDETVDQRPAPGPAADEDADPIDALAEEFAARCRRGEAPTVAEYEARHPELADRLRRLLPTVLLMERLKREPTAPGLPGRMGEFRIVRELGRGGMGVVYEAVQESLGRHVALKVIHRSHLDRRRLERFRREAQAVARLHHTNIVPIFAVGDHDGLPYFAMQFIDGRGLDAILDERRAAATVAPGASREAARIGLQVAEALQYAHEQGVLHRDIKPANLLLDAQGIVWVTDFGLAKLADQEDLTESGDVIGTLRYLAPESLRGQTDARSDVYSLGLALYELLTLAAPFGDVSGNVLLRQVGEGHLPRPSQVRPGIPADLETIVLAAIAREPSHRYATAAALAEDLRRFLDDRPILARRASPPERAWRWARRNRLPAALLAFAALSLLVAAAVGWIGYAATRQSLARESQRRQEAERATDRADRTVALALDVFSSLFDDLNRGRDPFPPAPGRAQPGRGRGGPGRGDGPGGPGRDGPPPGNPPDDAPGAPGFPAGEGPRLAGGPPDDEPGTPGFPAGEGPRVGGRRFDGGPPRSGGPGGLAGGPGGRPPGASAAPSTDLIADVLGFYDRFARENETNPKLQGEAARAYVRVGSLYDRLGRADEAERATARAYELLDDLATHHPEALDYQYRLVELVILTNPWTVDPSALDRLEGRLRRARALVDHLVEAAPDVRAYLQDAVHVEAKLGVVLERLGRRDEAEVAYRRAIAAAGRSLERHPDDDRVRIDRADVREALGMLRSAAGDREGALAQLQQAADDLAAVSAPAALAPLLSDRYTLLAEDLRALDRPETAAELDRRASSARTRPAPPDDAGAGAGAGPRPVRP